MADTIKFSTKDRYFSDKNEARIGRVSFLIRMLFIFIMTVLIEMAISMWLVYLMGMSIELLSPTVVMIFTLILLFSVPILVKKRSHDFDSNGKTASYAILGSLGLNLILNIITQLHFSTASFGSSITPIIFIHILVYSLIGFGITSIFIVLMLLFQPGTVGINSYGKLLK